MAGITQTIPNYNGGMSEQPDQLKRPGQVKNIINGIPDVTQGLYKRPGSSRVGTAKLVDVQTNGTWFHYYRDEDEGAYIGQVASDGKVRVWKCSDGSAVDVEYDTAGQAYNGSDGDHTSITSYLEPSAATATEDIQALTINDTTFLNNRTKIVRTTGTTPAKSDTYSAYIELQRAENGRQYGLNIYDDNTKQSITKITRARISGDDLNTDGGTGRCRGIGTEVFLKTDGSKKNFVFRLDILGQSGIHENANADDSGIDGGGYCCAYNKDITVLHGGEGWATNDTFQQQMNSAEGGAGSGNSNSSPTYNITIDKVETALIKSNIKAVRPEPTPFDSDTCVTTDSILGGIKAEIDTTNISSEIIGNGIYLTRSSAFNVEIVDADLMKVIQNNCDAIQDLPMQCKHGYVVKVSNAKQSDEDDVWMKFEGDNDKDGAGKWVECAEPGIALSFDATTMPHVLQRQSNGKFLVKKHDWADRLVGDDKTNLIPTFAGKKDGDFYKTINRVLFFRNRLVFLSGTDLICSKAGKLNDFWSETALTVSAIDPIDITSSSSFPSELYDGIEIAAGLLVFSSNQQFLLSSDAEVFNPDTAKLRPVSAYNYNIKIPPISTGIAIGYVDNSGKYSRFNEMLAVARESEPMVGEISKVVPTLLKKNIDLITNSRENSIIFFGKTGEKEVVGYKYFQNGEKREQSAWFTWKFKNSLIYHFIIDDHYYYIDSNHFLQKINIIQADTDPAIIDSDANNLVPDGTDFLIHLDNWTTVSNGTYDGPSDTTTFTNQSDWIDTVTDGDENLVIVDTNTTAPRIGRYCKCTVQSGDDFTVPGDWSTGTFYIGYLYDYQVELPRIYATQTQGGQTKADVNAYLNLHRMHLNFGKIGLYETTLKRVGKDDYNEVYESAISNEYNVSDTPYLAEEIKTIPIYERNENVDIVVKSTHPAPAVLYSTSWEGDYSQKYYRRA